MQQPKRATGKRTRATLAELEYQARSRASRQRAADGGQPASSAGAGGSSEGPARAEGVQPAEVQPAPQPRANGASSERPRASAAGDPEAQVERRGGQPSSSADVGGSDEEDEEQPQAREESVRGQAQLMHRSAAAVALRISKDQEEAWKAAAEVAAAAQETAHAQLRAAQEQQNRANELVAAAARQKAEMEAAATEYVTIKKALKEFEKNYKKSHGRYPKKGDHLDYEYRKGLERYNALKAKYPSFSSRSSGH